MNKKGRSLRFISLIFSLLFICSACGSTPETPATPGPAASPSPPATPGPAASPSPPAVSPDLSPVPGDEEPDIVFFLTYKDAFAVTNEEGQVLSYDNEAFSSTMDIFEQKYGDGLEPDTFFAKLPYSGHYVCERVDELAQLEESYFSVGAIIPGCGFRNYFSVKSSGILQRVEYDESGELYIAGDTGSVLEIAMSMCDGVLGKEGFVRFALASSHEEMDLKVQGNMLSFSGLEPQPIILYCGGVSPMLQEVLELTCDSGTIELSEDADGKLVVSVDYPEA